MNNITEAKKYVWEHCVPNISTGKTTFKTKTTKKEFTNILSKFRPDLVITNLPRGISIKKHIIFCFLNDEKLTEYTKHFIIDENFNRIIENVTFKEYCKIMKGKQISVKFGHHSSLIKYGFDLKLPRIMGYDTHQMSKIIKRVNAKHITCEVCGKYVKINFKGQRTCGIKCQATLTSKRMQGSNNPSVKYYDKIFTDEYRLNSSNRVKMAIADGIFTPKITNSWANSKVNIKEFDNSFRSSWEAYFYIYMIRHGHNIHFEKVRIKYFDSVQQKYRNYITDFVDYENKIIYEIKPTKCKDTQNVIDKETTALKWCSENGYEFKFICDDWFIKNYHKSLVNKTDMDYNNKEKLLRCLKRFESNK